MAASTEMEARAERTLPDGTEIEVRIKSGLATDERAVAALKAAERAVVEWAAPETKTYPRRIIGESPQMLALFKMMDRVQGSDATVLVTGENGTGKELVAKTIHETSKRGSKAFVAVNCSAFNDNLLESELFGHKRGAFTGAVTDKPGLFAVADGGTFLMDEVGDMTPALQVKLLRVLQEGTFTPVGATSSKKVDVRIIAATNRDLSKMVSDGSFREDLYYRLHVVELRVPALREREGDVERLASFFMDRLAKRDGKRKMLSRTCVERLLAHPWPGNVRELENEIERLWVLSGDDAIVGEEHLTPSVLSPNAPRVSASSDTSSIIPEGTLPDAVARLERQMIADRLEQCGGNKTKAAEQLGISRRNLIRKVQTYDL